MGKLIQGNYKNLKFNNVEALRNVSGSRQGESAELLGHTVSGDGGAGPLRIWDEGQSPGFYVDNNISIIVPGDGSAAWLFENPNIPFNVRWGGAKVDDITDDSAAVQNVADAAGPFGAIDLDIGRCRISGVTIPQGMTVSGVDNRSSVFVNVTGATGYVMSPEGGNYKLKNFGFEAAQDDAGAGVFLFGADPVGAINSGDIVHQSVRMLGGEFGVLFGLNWQFNLDTSFEGINCFGQRSGGICVGGFGGSRTSDGESLLSFDQCAISRSRDGVAVATGITITPNNDGGGASTTNDYVTWTSPTEYFGWSVMRKPTGGGDDEWRVALGQRPSVNPNQFAVLRKSVGETFDYTVVRKTRAVSVNRIGGVSLPLNQSQGFGTMGYFEGCSRVTIGSAHGEWNTPTNGIPGDCWGPICGEESRAIVAASIVGVGMAFSIGQFVNTGMTCAYNQSQDSKEAAWLFEQINSTLITQLDNISFTGGEVPIFHPLYGSGQRNSVLGRYISGDIQREFSAWDKFTDVYQFRGVDRASIGADTSGGFVRANVIETTVNSSLLTPSLNNTFSSEGVDRKAIAISASPQPVIAVVMTENSRLGLVINYTIDNRDGSARQTISGALNVAMSATPSSPTGALTDTQAKAIQEGTATVTFSIAGVDNGSTHTYTISVINNATGLSTAGIIGFTVSSRIGSLDSITLI